MNLLGVFGVGPTELIVVAILGLGLCGLPLAVLAVVLLLNRSRRGQPAEAPCPACGKPIPSVARFCPNCGRQLA